MAKKLNNQSKDILDARRKAMKNQIAQGFSVIFMGDTHIHMCGNTNQARYEKMLNVVKSEKTMIAVINGGDGVHSDNLNNMTIFRQSTEKILMNPFKKKEDKIPLFANVGNHEYFSKNFSMGISPIDNYNSLIGTAEHIQTYRLTPNSANVKVLLDLILLDTGGWQPNGFPQGFESRFLDQIKAIDAYIASEINKFKPKPVRFIIDMHIPPKVGVLGKPSSGTPHYLREPYNKAFLTLLDHHQTAIIAVVTHHRHCDATKVKYKKTPIFITTHAGQCTHGNTRLEYIRLIFKPFNNKTYHITNSKDKSYVVNVQK